MALVHLAHVLRPTMCHEPWQDWGLLFARPGAHLARDVWLATCSCGPSAPPVWPRAARVTHSVVPLCTCRLCSMRRACSFDVRRLLFDAKQSLFDAQQLPFDARPVAAHDTARLGARLCALVLVVPHRASSPRLHACSLFPPYVSSLSMGHSCPYDSLGSLTAHRPSAYILHHCRLYGPRTAPARSTRDTCRSVRDLPFDARQSPSRCVHGTTACCCLPRTPHVLPVRCALCAHKAVECPGIQLAMLPLRLHAVNGTWNQTSSARLGSPLPVTRKPPTRRVATTVVVNDHRTLPPRVRQCALCTHTVEQPGIQLAVLPLRLHVVNGTWNQTSSARVGSPLPITRKPPTRRVALTVIVDER